MKRNVSKLVGLLAPRRAWEAIQCLTHLPANRKENEEHLRSAMEWLCRAQDSIPGGGVSYAYSLFEGWLPPYPETTGYIIPTFLAYANYTGDDQYRSRAVRMAEWEMSVQLPDGGVPGGAYNVERPAKAVSFDTGQVLQGYCALYEITRDERVFDAARRAAGWLQRNQREDGAWEDTAPGRSQAATFAFNTRTAWPLLDFAAAGGGEEYRSVAWKNLEWTLRQQRPNGWFQNAAFSAGELPLTHTVGYILEGLLECWQRTGERRLLEAVERASDPLLEAYTQASVLPAWIDSDWTLKGNFACVTGSAQMVRVWLMLDSATGNTRARQAARRLVEEVKRWQVMRGGPGNMEGALPGSFPIYGGYETLRFQNWGVKFFADALLAVMQQAEEFRAAVEVSGVA